jgi:cytosine/creatinine deaminase
VRLNGVTLSDGRRIDVRLEGGVISELDGALQVRNGEHVLDLDGYVLLPAAAEPHAHLDKALTADLVPNPAGDLMGAIEGYHRFGATQSAEAIATRAEKAARILVRNGATAIRTHVDVRADIGTRSVEALNLVKQRVDGLVDIQIVALVGSPLTGVTGASNRSALRDAMQAGADVVGGCPHLDNDPDRCQRYLLELAGELGLPIDLHTDESLNAESLDLPAIADWVLRNGFRWGVTASHCVTLGLQDEATQQRVAEQTAAAGIAVVTLPQTNLFLLGRDQPVATPRGLTALRALLRAGVRLSAGGDNLQDPFNTMGRGDPAEIASLLVTAGHLTVEEAWHAVSTSARATMGLDSSGIVKGAPAELVAVPANSLREAMAYGPADRVVFHRGLVVSGPPAFRAIG